MIFPRGMTNRGKQLSFLFALMILFMLPKHVDCGYPDGVCTHLGMFKRVCTSYEVEPFGFYVIEKLAHRNVGFAYKAGEDCR